MALYLCLYAAPADLYRAAVHLRYLGYTLRDALNMNNEGLGAWCIAENEVGPEDLTEAGERLTEELRDVIPFHGLAVIQGSFIVSGARTPDATSPPPQTTTVYDLL